MTACPTSGQTVPDVTDVCPHCRGYVSVELDAGRWVVFPHNTRPPMVVHRAWLIYEFRGDNLARIGWQFENGNFESLRWAYLALRNVALNGLRPDPLGGTWWCEVRS